MRAVFLVLLSLLFIFPTWSQSKYTQQSISLNNNYYSIIELINEIQNQSDFNFSYTNNFNTSKIIEVENKTYTINKLLNLIVDKNEFKIIYDNNKAFIVKLAISEQTYVVSGFISDEKTGESLISTTIYNPTTYKGTVSNNFGFFSFQQTKNNKQFIVSYLGYKKAIIHFSECKDTVIKHSVRTK